MLLSIRTNLGGDFFSPRSAAICISLSNFTTQILKLLFLAMASVKMERENPPSGRLPAHKSLTCAPRRRSKIQMRAPSGLHGLNLPLTANAAEASRRCGSILWVIISEKCGPNGGWRWRLGRARGGGGAFFLLLCNREEGKGGERGLHTIGGLPSFTRGADGSHWFSATPCQPIVNWPAQPLHRNQACQ